MQNLYLIQYIIGTPLIPYKTRNNNHSLSKNLVSFLWQRKFLLKVLNFREYGSISPFNLFSIYVKVSFPGILKCKHL